MYVDRNSVYLESVGAFDREKQIVNVMIPIEIIGTERVNNHKGLTNYIHNIQK